MEGWDALQPTRGSRPQSWRKSAGQAPPPLLEPVGVFVRCPNRRRRRRVWQRVSLTAIALTGA